MHEKPLKPPTFRELRKNKKNNRYGRVPPKKIKGKSTGGRPPEWDVDFYTKEIQKWAKRDDSINLCGFCAEYNVDFDTIIDFCERDVAFCRAFNAVKLVLGDRREKMLSEGTLAPRAYNLNARVYDKFLDKKKKELAIFEAKLKSLETNDENKGTVADLLNNLKSTTELLNEIETLKKKLRKSGTKI